MKRLMLMVLLFTICNMTLSVTPINATTDQNPLQKLGFSRCNLAPCFLGIIPGKTSWNDASSILLKHDFKQNKSGIAYSKQESIQSGILINRVLSKPDVVNSVSFSDLEQYYKVTLPDVVALYGYPCVVQSDFEGSFWFSYPTMIVHVLSDNKHYLTAPVIYFEFGDPELPINSSGISTCQTRQEDFEWLLWFTF